MLTSIRLDSVWPVWVRCSCALGIAALALLVRATLLPVGGGHAFLVFFPASMLAMLVCGVGPGLLALVVTAGIAYFVFTVPIGTFAHHPAADVPVALYLMSGVLLALVVGSLHSYAARLKSAMESLSATERRLHAIADHVPLGIVYYDREDRVQFANREFRRINGSNEDPGGRPARDYLNPEIYDATTDARTRALAGERVRQMTHVQVEGEVRAREVSSIPEFGDEGAVLGVYVLGYDVTESERLGAQLRQAREDLEAILNNVPARITSWHADGTNRFANRAAEQALGLLPGEGTGKHLRELFGSRQYELDRPNFEAVLTGETRTGEQQELLPDGGMRYRQVSYVPQWRDEAVVGLYALETDITELRASYDRIRQLAQRLESIREDERRSVAGLLHEGLAQDLFATGMGLRHLQARVGAAAELRAAFGELAEAINRCIAATRQIANDLHPSALAHLRVSAALKDHARYFGELSGLQIEVAEVPPFPVLDESRRLVLFRVAQEALTNVARHAQASRVWILLSATDAHVTMEVEDDGIGVAAAAQDKPGALGLLGMRERVGSLGGDVSLRARLPRGTTVSVRLPVEGRQQPHAPLFAARAPR